MVSLGEKHASPATPNAAPKATSTGAPAAPKTGGRGRSGAPRTANITDSRIAASAMLADLRGGLLLDAAFDRHAAPLEIRDRRWVQELVWGMLRRRGWIDAVLAPRVTSGVARLDADVADLLRLGVYQLLFMGSVPPYAAIAQTVELAKQRHGIGAGKLVNAILRRVDRERDTLEPLVPTDPIDALVMQESHPRWLVQRWVRQFGLEGATALLKANNQEAPIILRPFGVSRAVLAEQLDAVGLAAIDAPLLDDSLQLPPGVPLASLEVFTEGKCFVQDPAATLVTRFAAIPADSVVGDLCAAPGGKTLELSKTARLVVACDKQPLRMERVVLGMGRLDVQNIAACVCDARHPALHALDAILVDVPCTGTGTFRRHPDARWRLKPSDLATMQAVQRDILEAASTCVRPGGLLIYSTCSLEPEENEVRVADFLATHPEFQLEPPPVGHVPNAVVDNGMLRVLPHRHGADGSFAARMRRAA